MFRSAPISRNNRLEAMTLRPNAPPLKRKDSIRNWRSITPARLFIALVILWPLAASAGLSRDYGAELNEAIAHLRNGSIPQALTRIEESNAGDDKDILYYLEKGELLNLGSDYAASRDAWLKGDEVIQAWENEYRANPSKFFGDLGSYLISDKTRRYDGQDYEKVMLSTRLTLDHILLGNHDHARVEMKKTYEREKLIESFREQEYEALKAENSVQNNGTVTNLDGYPMAELDTPEVRELKNGFQNAFAHYLAGYFFEVTGEPSLAEPGYRNALQLAPGNPVIQRALDEIGRAPRPADHADVLFVIETGFAPAIESLSIPIPVPRKSGLVTVPLSFPVIKSQAPVAVPPALSVGGRQLPVVTLTNTDTMARRLLKDQMGGIVLRTIIRAGLKSVIQEQANKAHWIAGLIANVVAVATEQADDRSWRSLPERISVARSRLPYGRQTVEFQTTSGGYRSEIDVRSPFIIVPIRITDGAVFVRQPGGSGNGTGSVLAGTALPPTGPGLAPAIAPSAPATASPTPTTLAPPPIVVAKIAPPAPARLPAEVNLGARVVVGETTYIGDFRFAQPSGLANGQGIVEWTNGLRYEGPIVDGQRHGRGVFIFPGSSRYEGDWDRDVQTGQGRTVFDNGDTYEGGMKNGQFDGRGVYVSTNGTVYDGEWKQGIREGQGRMTFPDGDYWEGHFHNDERTDQGQMVLKNKPQAPVATETDVLRDSGLLPQ